MDIEYYRDTNFSVRVYSTMIYDQMFICWTYICTYRIHVLDQKTTSRDLYIYNKSKTPQIVALLLTSVAYDAKIFIFSY